MSWLKLGLGWARERERDSLILQGKRRGQYLLHLCLYFDRRCTLQLLQLLTSGLLVVLLLNYFFDSQEQSMELKKTQMKVDVKDIGDKWNQLPEEEKNKYIQMGKLQSEQYAQLKTVVQQKPLKNFDPSTHSLNVHGLRMLLTVEDVHELMGLPSNGLPVKLTESLFYLEQFARKRELVATSNSIPRLSYWGNLEIKQVALPNIGEKSNAITLSQGRIDKNDDSRLAKVEKQVIEIHALLVQGHKDTRQDEDEKRLTKVENQVEKILELLEKHMPVDGEQVKTPPNKLLAEQRLVKMENQVGQILELLERHIPVDGGHVKTPPRKLHEEHRIDIEMVGLDDSGIEKVATNSPKFVDKDEIRNMNDKKPMETLHLRKTKPILTPPNAKAVAKKRAKLVGGKALNNEQLSIPQKGRLRAKKSDTKAVEMNAVTMSSSCSVVRGPQTRGTQNCKASQWLHTPFVKFDVKKKRPQLKPSSTDNNVDNNIHDNLDESSVPLPDPLNDYDSLVLRYAFDESLSEGYTGPLHACEEVT
ncbi:hypothetical protein HYC85_021020 [Camellia sinensis]|uniref:Uncharacterized protein n=1 Tax=Camellia sinensis TaxID=4442 RepID=A0A7J7GGF7_CAMSI|nr:hypothetical protein HYC85_021020 [Camellia sinensis]